MDKTFNGILDKHIIQYYDTCEIDYKIVWKLRTHMAMHYGYWEKETVHLGDALHNLNRKIGVLADFQPGKMVLDAGCGVGGSSIFFAKNSISHFHGISLSENQVLKARKNAENHNVEDRVSFSVQNYCKTDFPDGSFDVIFAIESVCHASNKVAFLREAHRLLKKGGRLVIADFFKVKTDYLGKDKILVEKWAETWAVPDFHPHNTFMEETESVGFKIQVSENATPKIYKSARLLYYCFFPGLITHHFLSIFRVRNHTHSKNVWSTYYQYVALKKNLWNYHILMACKL